MENECDCLDNKEDEIRGLSGGARTPWGIILQIDDVNEVSVEDGVATINMSLDVAWSVLDTLHQLLCVTEVEGE